ncbi:hypothetical protein [Frankia sp. AgKG'84/4]
MSESVGAAVLPPAGRRAGGTDHRCATLRLPYLTARFEVDPPPAARLLRVGPLPLPLPAPARTAYYLGLGTVAVVGLVGRPVALAVAAGSYVAGRASTGQPTSANGSGPAGAVSERRGARARRGGRTTATRAGSGHDAGGRRRSATTGIAPARRRG